MRGRQVLLSLTTGLVLSVSGCGAGDGGGEPSSTGSAGSPSAEASPSAGDDGEAAKAEAEKRATSATKKALLPTKEFAEIGAEEESAPETKVWDWFDTCTPSLPSEVRQVVGTSGTWGDGTTTISQTVTAYPDGVAQTIVGEAEKAVAGCTEFGSNNKEYTDVAPVDLGEVEKVEAITGWCMVEKESGAHVCYSALAAQDLVSTIWVSAESRKGALDGVLVLSQLAAARIAAQIS